MPELSLYVRLLPAGVLPEVLGFGELLALGELDPDRGQHRPPVAGEGTGERGLVAGHEGRAVVLVAREDVVEVRHHSVTARASLKPGVSAKVLTTSSGSGASRGAGRGVGGARGWPRGSPSPRYRAGLVEAGGLRKGLEDLFGDGLVHGDGH